MQWERSLYILPKHMEDMSMSYSSSAAMQFWYNVSYTLGKAVFVKPYCY